jgi:ABC-2 type transport system permease protein
LHLACRFRADTAAAIRIVSGVDTTPLLEAPASPFRAWLALLRLSVRRQARMRQMVWIAVGLMAMTVLFVGLNTYFGRWSYMDRRARPSGMTYRYYLLEMENQQSIVGRSEPAGAIHAAVVGAARAAADNSGFLIFSRWVVFAIFQSFLLPLWTLSFATDALGNERESRTLIWMFTRPLPRWSAYLAKWLAALPWCLGLNLAGFAAICVAAGQPGYTALEMFWPAVLWGTLAFSALFHLIAAVFRRPAIIALLYSFFFETLVSDLPGDLKRVSISFYIRSLMFDATSKLSIEPDSLTVYAPVRGATALAVLVGAAVVFTLIGMWVFSRKEYLEDV